MNPSQNEKLTQVSKAKIQKVTNQKNQRKIFKENIIGLNSDEESSKKENESNASEELNELQYIQPPPDDDAPMEDEYFDQDEEYLENESERDEFNKNDQGILIHLINFYRCKRCIWAKLQRK